MFKKLPRKAIIKLTFLINTVFRMEHVSDVWKIAEVNLIPKPSKRNASNHFKTF